MPRDHGRILTTIWQDRDFQKLSPDAQRLYMLLLSQPDINNAGVLPMRLSKWAKGCIHTDPSHLRCSLHELQECRFAFYDDDTEEVLIRAYIRRDGVLKHPNLTKSALKCAEATESQMLRLVLIDELNRTGRNDAKSFAERMASESHPDAIPMPSECHSDAIQPDDAIRMPFESHPNSCGVGVGEGERVTLVSTQVGESEKPPPRKSCNKHPDGTDTPCRPCAQARESHEAWERNQLALAAQHRAAFRTEILGCPDCDERGWIETSDGEVTRCPEHDWSAADASQ